jgi:hypothetical protein
MPVCNSSWPVDPNPGSTLTFADIKEASNAAFARKGSKPSRHTIVLMQAKVGAP